MAANPKTAGMNLLHMPGSQQVRAVEDLVTTLLSQAGYSGWTAVYIQRTQGKFEDGVELLRIGTGTTVTLRVKPVGNPPYIAVLTYDRPEMALQVRTDLAMALSPEVKPSGLGQALQSATPEGILIQVGAQKDLVGQLTREANRAKKAAEKRERLDFTILSNIILQLGDLDAISGEELEIVNEVAQEFKVELDKDAFVLLYMDEVSPGVHSLKLETRQALAARISNPADTHAQELLEDAANILGRCLVDPSECNGGYPGILELAPLLLRELFAEGENELSADEAEDELAAHEMENRVQLWRQKIRALKERRKEAGHVLSARQKSGKLMGKYGRRRHDPGLMVQHPCIGAGLCESCDRLHVEAVMGEMFNAPVWDKVPQFPLISAKLRSSSRGRKKRVSMTLSSKPEAWSGELDKATERLIDRDRLIACLKAGEPAQPR